MPTYQDWLTKRKERVPKPFKNTFLNPSEAQSDDQKDDVSVVSGSVYSAGGTRMVELTKRISKLEDTVITLAEQIQQMASTLETVLSTIEGSERSNRRVQEQPNELDSSPILEK